MTAFLKTKKIKIKHVTVQLYIVFLKTIRVINTGYFEDFEEPNITTIISTTYTIVQL